MTSMSVHRLQEIREDLPEIERLRDLLVESDRQWGGSCKKLAEGLIGVEELAVSLDDHVRASRKYVDALKQLFIKLTDGVDILEGGMESHPGPEFDRSCRVIETRRSGPSG